MEKFITNTLFFVVNPKIDAQKSNKYKWIIYGYFTCISWLILSVLFLSIVGMIIKSFDSSFDISKLTLKTKGISHSLGYFVIGSFIGPLIEETIFRLPLVINRDNIAIAFSVGFYYFCTISFSSVLFDFTNWNTFVVFGISILIFFGCFYSKKLIILIANLEYQYFVWASILLFGLSHVLNFIQVSWYYYPIYVLMVLPQVGYAIVLSFVRLKLKHGFLGAFLIHVMINLPLKSWSDSPQSCPKTDLW